eukprot:8554890-Alexandrium_andersonii.AAC.1
MIGLRLESGLITLLKSPPEAMRGARQPGRVPDPAEAAAEWSRVAGVLKQRGIPLQVETPFPIDLMSLTVWQNLPKAADGWRWRAEVVRP